MGLDAQELRRVLHDFFRFNPKDFRVQASPTGFLVSANLTSSSNELQPFQIIDASNQDDGTQVRVVESTLLGDLPDGFSPADKPPYILPVGDGYTVYAGVVFDVSGEFPGDVTSRFLDAQAMVPDDEPDTGTFYMPIGNVSLSTDGNTTIPVNTRYGPIDGTCYRLWFSSPKIFGMAWA